MSGYAQAVLVVGEPGRPKDYYRHTKSEAKGQIGLVGVSRIARGRGIGQALLLESLHWFSGQGMASAEVATQGRNIPAQRLYQKCGFVTKEGQALVSSLVWRKMSIPFNRPVLVGNELNYLQQAIASEHISGDGIFTKKCSSLLEQELGVPKVLLTTSCTHALEMTALLLNMQPGDEVIIPSFTFVSTVNAFVVAWRPTQSLQISAPTR